MTRRITPTATRVARDPLIDSLTTEWLIQWPGKPGRTWGKTYIAIERRNRVAVLLTAARRQPVRIVQRNRLIDAVKAAIYAAKSS